MALITKYFATKRMFAARKASERVQEAERVKKKKTKIWRGLETNSYLCYL